MLVKDYTDVIMWGKCWEGKWGLRKSQGGWVTRTIKTNHGKY